MHWVKAIMINIDLLFIAVCLFIFMMWLDGTALAEPISEHNELQAAIKAGYNYMFDAGCKRPTHSRTERYELQQTQEGLQLIGLHLTFICTDSPAGEEQPGPVADLHIATLKWPASTKRFDGTLLDENEIAFYLLAHNQVLTEVQCCSHTIIDVPKGNHIFSIAAVNIEGTAGGFTDPISVDVK